MAKYAKKSKDAPPQPALTSNLPSPSTTTEIIPPRKPLGAIEAMNLVSSRQKAAPVSDLLDGLSVIKALVAILIGLVVGYLPVLGLHGAFTFFSVYLTGSLFICRTWLGFEDNDLGGTLRILSEGGPPSLALFLLTWITTYTIFHTI